eukprot:96828-Alexandrium_andersonii.AAC.1
MQLEIPHWEALQTPQLKCRLVIGRNNCALAGPEGGVACLLHQLPERPVGRVALSLRLGFC